MKVRIQKHVRFECSRDGQQWKDITIHPNGLGMLSDVMGEQIMHVRQLVSDQEVNLTDTGAPIGLPYDVGLEYPVKVGFLKWTPNK